MIISQLSGGLGNQLFQYAAGYAIAERLNTNLFLYFHINECDTKRDQIIKELVSDIHWLEFKQLKPFIPHSFISKFKQRILPVNKRSFFKERDFTFDDRVLNISDNTLINGYWQSEDYFSRVSDKVRDTILSKLNTIELDKSILNNLTLENSISLHVRKGDYLIFPYSDYYYELQSEYYERALECLSSKIAFSKIFVFTDDVNWVNEHLKIGFDFQIVSQTFTKSVLEDMRAMSLCNHHIIANSSFSWWSAWLSQNPNKQVVAPLNWFKSVRKSTKNLIPERWLRV